MNGRIYSECGKIVNLLHITAINTTNIYTHKGKSPIG